MRIYKRKYSTEQEIEMKNLYLTGGKNTYDIMQIYNAGYGTVWGILNRQGVIKRNSSHYRKYEVKMDFFEIINTEEKAYFLGWLYSDGNVSGDMKITSLKLRQKDEEILEKLDMLIHYEKTIYRYQKNTVLLICCKKIANDLLKLGCMPNKTFKIEFPNSDIVPNHLLNHFIRGVFDGDGSVGHIGQEINKAHFANIVGTEHFCNNLLIKLKEFNPIVNAHLDHINDKNTCVLRFYGNNVFRFFRYLYQDASIYLQRKFNTFNREIDFFRSTKKRRKNNWDVYDFLNKELLIKIANPVGQSLVLV